LKIMGVDMHSGTAAQLHSLHRCCGAAAETEQCDRPNPSRY
jgi:hypothetical protein